MFSRSRLWVLAQTTAATLLVASCSGGGRGPLYIGAVYNLTGAQSELDLPSAEGAQLAVDEANRAGGVLGRRVRLVVEDGASDPGVIATKTAEALQRFDSSPAWIGLSDTDMVLAAAPIAAAAGRAFLTSGATSPQLPGEVPDWLFLACFGDNVQAAAAAEWAYSERGARSVSILYSMDSSYTMLLQGYFRSRFEQLGGEVRSVTSYTLEDLNEDAVRDVAPADLIFLSAQPEDALLAVQLLRAADVNVAVLGGDGLDSADLWEQHPELDDVYFTTHAWLGDDNDTVVVHDFRKAYEQAHPGRKPDAFTALGYDTARLLLDAIERADSDDPAAVRDALAATSAFEGVTGQISFRNGSRIPSKSVTLVEVDAGTRRLVTQFVPEQVPDP